MTVRLEDDEEILDPIVQGIKKYQIYEWRDYLRHRLYIKRKGKSDLTGKTLGHGFHMHEALFQRRWLPKDEQLCLFTEYNVLLLRPEEHIPEPPSREEAYRILRGYYEEELDKWVETLPFKVKPDMPWKS